MNALEVAQNYLRKNPESSRRKVAMVAEVSPKTLRKWESDGLVKFDDRAIKARSAKFRI